MYISAGSDLYTVNTFTGAATLDETLGSFQLGAIVMESGTLYGGADSPNNDIININNNDSTVSALSGTSGNFWGLAATVVPEPLPAPVLGAAMLLAAMGMRRHKVA